jgi:hypothetical protein
MDWDDPAQYRCRWPDFSLEDENKMKDTIKTDG